MKKPRIASVGMMTLTAIATALGVFAYILPTSAAVQVVNEFVDNGVTGRTESPLVYHGQIDCVGSYGLDEFEGWLRIDAEADDSVIYRGHQIFLDYAQKNLNPDPCQQFELSVDVPPGAHVNNLRLVIPTGTNAGDDVVISNWGPWWIVATQQGVSYPWLVASLIVVVSLGLLLGITITRRR